MSVHLYTNGAWTDSGKIYRNSLNLFDGVIGRDNVVISEFGNDNPNPNYALSNLIPVDSETEYTFSFYHSTVETRVTYTISEYDENGNVILPITIRTINDLGIISFTFTTGASTKYIKLNWKKPYDVDLMLVKGSAIPYEPYNVVDWYTNYGHGYSSGAWS